MRVLVIGSGGREHALVWKLAQSNLCEKVFVAPGNAGTADEPKTENVDLSAEDLDGLLDFAKNKEIDLTIVGPEAPLVLGLIDLFEKNNLLCLGPNKLAAQMEGSKIFMKDVLRKGNIPTATYEVFSDPKPAREYLEKCDIPIVLKADGLAGGKGVIVAFSREEALEALNSLMVDQKLGSAGDNLVIEEFLKGEEASFIVLCDGENVIPLASSQDHKQRDDGDKGPNTGGMGAYSPTPLITEELNEEIMKEYGEIELPSQYPHQIKDIDNIDMENQLTEQYRRPIILKDVDERDNTALYCIFRQLKRLQYCVQFLKYRFGIIYKDYLAILRSDNTIKCYRIRNNEHTEYRSLYITIDLEVFYENSKVLNEDLEQLQNGIRGVLDKNQEVQSKHLDTMLTQQQQIITVLSKLQQRKINIRIELQKFKELFKIIEESIKTMMNKIHELGQLIAQSIGQKQEQYVKEKHNIYMRLTQLYSKKEETAQAIINNRK